MNPCFEKLERYLTEIETLEAKYKFDDLYKNPIFVKTVVLIIGAEKISEQRLKSYCQDKYYAYQSSVSDNTKEFVFEIRASNAVYLMNSNAASFEFLLNLVLFEKITEIKSKTKHHNALNEIKLCRLADYILLVYNCYYQEDLIFYSVNERAFKEKIHVILLQKLSTSIVKVNGEPLDCIVDQIFENNDNEFIKNKVIFSLFISMQSYSLSKI